MMTIKFDPFNDRLARDLRNRLSTAMVRSLVSGDLSFFSMAADACEKLDLLPAHRDYLAGRREKFARLVEIRALSPTVWDVAIDLWNNDLFFEVHEILEDAWKEADGRDREIMQAMIRAAGVQVHLAAGNEKGARRMALRAWPVLEKYHDHLPIKNGGELVRSLKSEDLFPVRLLKSGAK